MNVFNLDTIRYARSEVRWMKGELQSDEEKDALYLNIVLLIVHTLTLDLDRSTSSFLASPPPYA